MSSTHLTLVFNGLLDAQRVLEAHSNLVDCSLTSLQTLLSKADYHFNKKVSEKAQAAYLFHQPNTPALAITSALGLCELNAEQRSEFWLSVDPVQMIPDRDTLVLIPGKDLGITESESLALLDSFNMHFAEDGVQLLYGSPTQWFLSIKQPVAIQTTPLEEVAYQSLNDKYPQGAAGNYWRQLMNETQMLFYNHEVNQQRRLQNFPEINSVWVWGEGVLQEQQLVKRPNAAIFAESSYLQGLAKLTDATLRKAPKSFADWHRESESIRNNGLQKQQAHHALIELQTSLFANIALENMTLEHWLALLSELEQQWFAPIFDALKNKQLSSVLLVLGANKHYLLKPSHLKRFWRLKKRWSGLVN